jgi:hypothetical protein
MLTLGSRVLGETPKSRGSEQKPMETSTTNTAADNPNRKYCRLLEPVRDHEGHIRFTEAVEIIKEIDNLDRHMYLVRFEDGSTTFVFPHEVEVLTGSPLRNAA